MAATPQIIAQLAPGAGSLVDLYDCPQQTMAEIASVIVCNRSSSASTFRVAVSKAGSSIADKQYLYYDLPVAANDTFAAALGLSTRPGDIVRVYASTATLTFSLLGDVTYPVPTR